MAHAHAHTLTTRAGQMREARTVASEAGEDLASQWSTAADYARAAMMGAGSASVAEAAAVEPKARKAKSRRGTKVPAKKSAAATRPRRSPRKPSRVAA